MSGSFYYFQLILQAKLHGGNTQRGLVHVSLAFQSD